MESFIKIKCLKAWEVRKYLAEQNFTLCLAACKSPHQFIASLRLEKISMTIKPDPSSPPPHPLTVSPSVTSLRFLNTSRNGDPTTSLGNPSQCLTALLEKQSFLIPNRNLPWHNLRPSPLILLLLPGRRDQPPLCYTLFSGSCGEPAGLLWASPATG